jgi:hypothetical protein
MISFKEYFYRPLLEALDPEIEVYDDDEEDPRKWIYKNNYKKLYRNGVTDVGFIYHHPSTNVYFFDRDQFLHNTVIHHIGLHGVDGILSGTYQAGARNKHNRHLPNTHISPWSSDSRLMNREFIDNEFIPTLYDRSYIHATVGELVSMDDMNNDYNPEE